MTALTPAGGRPAGSSDPPALGDLGDLAGQLDLDAVPELDLDIRVSHTGPAASEAFEPCYTTLEGWVAGVFAATYARRATPTFSWCAQWWRHPEAIVRLEALWRAWETLRLDPLLGMGTWFSGHLDHQLPILTGPSGPFAGCDPTRHFDPDTPQLAHQPAPPNWWPPDISATGH